MSTLEMVYVFIAESDLEQGKDLYSMQIDAQLSVKIVGAQPPSLAYCSTTNTDSSVLTRSILL